MSIIDKRKIDLKNVALSFNNPRWQDISNLETNLIKMIIQQSDQTTEKEVVKKILELEGDLRDFVDLIRSIAKGFRDYEQGIFVVQKNSHQYVVAEGNRRVLALKLLSKLVGLPKLSEIRKNYEYDPDDDWDEEYPIADKKKYLKNYEKIKEIINSENNVISGRTEFDFLIIDEDQNEILWEVIFSKHISGMKIGLRRWGRGKYFVDLLNFFPNGMKKKYEKWEEAKIESRLQKRLTKIKIDYKHAQFVFEIANADFQDANKAKEWMKKQPVSALQQNFSLNWVKKVAENYDYNSEDFKKLIFDFTYNEENYFLKIIDDERKIVDSNRILGFIKTWFEERLITTRSSFESAKKYSEFSAAFAKLVNKLSLNNPFNWKSDQIEREFEKSEDPWRKEYLDKLLKIKSRQEDVSWLISSRLGRFNGFWVKTIKDLDEQLVYNSKNNLKYIQASSITIRSILEIIVVCSSFFNPNILRQIVEKIVKQNKVTFEIKNGAQLNFMDKFCVLFLTNYAKIMRTTWFLTRLFRKNKNNLAENMITNILDQFEEHSFMDSFKYIWNKRFSMAEIIYNHFRMLREKMTEPSPIDEQLDIIDAIHKFVIDLLKQLDVEKLNLIDEKFAIIQTRIENNEIKVNKAN